MKKVLALILAAVLLVTFSGAAMADTSVDKKYTTAINDFGLKLAEKLEDGKNLVFSPASISLALQMTLMGAAGSTYSAIKNTIRLNNFKKSIQYYAGKYLSQLNQSSALSVANTTFISDRFQPNPKFLDILKYYFFATGRTLNFRSPEALYIINQWVNDATKGKITKLYDKLDDDLVMILLNAIAFEGEWQIKFDPNNNSTAPFYGKQSTLQTTMMNKTSAEWKYTSTSKYQAVKMAYKTGQSMIVLLPKSGCTPEKLLHSFNGTTFAKLLSSFKTKTGTVTIPKFKTEYEASLVTPLTKLGMGRAFDPKQADLSGIAGKKGDLVISDVKHKAYIEVDEEGTKAAAVTSVDIVLTSIQGGFEFVANKPFAYAIVDDATGTMLFLGIVNQL